LKAIDSSGVLLKEISEREVLFTVREGAKKREMVDLF